MIDEHFVAGAYQLMKHRFKNINEIERDNYLRSDGRHW